MPECYISAVSRLGLHQYTYTGAHRIKCNTAHLNLFSFTQQLARGFIGNYVFIPKEKADSRNLKRCATPCIPQSYIVLMATLS